MRLLAEVEVPSHAVVGRAMAAAIGVRDWILLDVNRYLLALGPLAVVFVLFVLLEFGGVVDIARSTTPLLYLFQALAAGNITLTTIVVSINQLVLSRELRSPRELQTEMAAADEFRGDVEEETDRLVVPEVPEEFLRLLARDTRTQVSKLEEAVEGMEATPVRTELVDLLTNLGTELDGTIDRLDESGGGVYTALSTVLDADFSTRLNHIRWLSRAYREDVPDDVLDVFEALGHRLEQLDVARQYFKTIYIKQELSDVSKLVMYTGLVAIVVDVVFIVVTGYRTTAFPPMQHLLLVPLAVTISLAPFTLLVSHVVRIATVAQRTAAITPFLAPAE